MLRTGEPRLQTAIGGPLSPKPRYRAVQWFRPWRPASANPFGLLPWGRGRSGSDVAMVTSSKRCRGNMTFGPGRQPSDSFLRPSPMPFRRGRAELRLKAAADRVRRAPSILHPSGTIDIPSTSKHIDHRPRRADLLAESRWPIGLRLFVDSAPYTPN